MDPRTCQTMTASPAEPGELPGWFSQAGAVMFHFQWHPAFPRTWGLIEAATAQSKP